MTVKFISKTLKITDDIQAQAEKKLSLRLKKYGTGDGELEITVKVSEKKPFTRVDVDMTYLHYQIHSEAESTEGVLSGIDRCIDILERQIDKFKTKMHRSKIKRQNSGASIAEEITAEEESYKVIKVEDFELLPMNAEEAALQLDVLENKFFVFFNTETETVSVVYKRDDGRTGLIET